MLFRVVAVRPTVEHYYCSLYLVHTDSTAAKYVRTGVVRTYNILVPGKWVRRENTNEIDMVVAFLQYVLHKVKS